MIKIFNSHSKIITRPILNYFQVALLSIKTNRPPNIFPLQLLTRKFHSSYNFKSTTGTVTKAFDVNTNVVKDVILFRYENPKFYKYVTIFAVSQFCFWSYLSIFAMTSLRDAPVDETKLDELPWWQSINLGENKYRNGITGLCFLFGYGILLVAFTFTLRSVRYLILRKGGKSVTLVTYTPFGKNRMMTVPLNCISAEQPRSASKVHLPLKVKDKILYYVLDMRGEFLNERLYDYSVGLKKRF